MLQVKRNRCMEPFNFYKGGRDSFATVFSSNITGSLLWAPDGSLYQVQDSLWYKLTVESMTENGG